MHSRVFVCDEISDLLVALSKCPNVPILIVDETPGAIHVLIHAAISVPEVVPAHLDLHRELADRPDPVRAALLALEMTTVAAILAVIHVVATAIGPLVVILAIVRAVIVTGHRVAILGIVPLVILVRVVIDLAVIVIGLLVVMALTHVVILVVAIALVATAVQVETVARVVNSGIGLVLIAVLVVNMAIVLLEIVLRVVSTETVRCVVMIHAATDPVVTVGPVLIVDPVVSTETDQLAIVDRVANMATVRFVAMTAVVIPAVVIVHLVETLEIDPAVIVIVHLVVISVIVTALRVVMIQVLTHVAATETVRRVVMVQALVVHRAHVVMTAVMVVVAVVLVAKTSHPVVQRTKQNVVVKPCARAAAAKCVKTANRLRCHAKPRPGSMKVESKMKSAIPPKALCAVRSHRDALCRRDQKMKTN